MWAKRGKSSWILLPVSNKVDFRSKIIYGWHLYFKCISSHSRSFCSFSRSWFDKEDKNNMRKGFRQRLFIVTISTFTLLAIFPALGHSEFFFNVYFGTASTQSDDVHVTIQQQSFFGSSTSETTKKVDILFIICIWLGFRILVQKIFVVWACCWPRVSSGRRRECGHKCYSPVWIVDVPLSSV